MHLKECRFQFFKQDWNLKALWAWIQKLNTKSLQEKKMFTFIAPFVAMALSDIVVKKVQDPQNATNRRPSPMPAMPRILQNEIPNIIAYNQ